MAYRRAIELDSQAVAAHFNLALLYQQQKKDKKAIDSLEQLLEIDPGHAWAHYQMGVSLERKGRRGAAVEEYAQAFALDAGLSFPRNNPQILDSWVATEGLLRAEAYLNTQANRVPRQFNEAARIRNLMLGHAGKATAATAKEGDGGGGGLESGAAARRGHPPAAGRRPARHQRAPTSGVVGRRPASRPPGDHQRGPARQQRRRHRLARHRLAVAEQLDHHQPAAAPRLSPPRREGRCRPIPRLRRKPRRSATCRPPYRPAPPIPAPCRRSASTCRPRRSDGGRQPAHGADRSVAAARPLPSQPGARPPASAGSSSPPPAPPPADSLPASVTKGPGNPWAFCAWPCGP